jgi:hypothetical protein
MIHLSKKASMKIKASDYATYFTGPSLSIAALVSGVSGVDARTQTSPVESRTAVERPPKGRI